jgi:hypothetical protein
MLRGLTARGSHSESVLGVKPSVLTGVPGGVGPAPQPCVAPDRAAIAAVVVATSGYTEDLLVLREDGLPPKDAALGAVTFSRGQ